MNIADSANKILSSVEANERQVRTQLEQIRAQHEQIAQKITHMEAALEEMNVMKTILLVAATNKEVGATITAAMETVA